MSLLRFFRRRRSDADLSREIAAHLEEERAENLARGLSPEEADRRARIKFGSPRRVHEDLWQQNSALALEGILRDLRYALRTLARTPGFTLTATVIMALGIGATTAMFTFVNAVLLRPLPFPEPDRLMWLAQQDHSLPGVAPQPLSYPDYFDWRRENHTFSGMASYVGGGMTLDWNGHSQRLDAQTVSSDFFQVLGVAPVLGRDFRSEDEKPGNRTLMLSYSLWQSTFGAAKDIVGRPIMVDGNSYTVAGVMPKGFQFPLENPGPALWISIADDVAGTKSSERGYDVLRIIGRIKPGVTVEQAKADVSIIAGNLAIQYPDSNKLFGSALVERELQHMVGDTRPALRILFGAVTLLLLIVCANLAGLLLARGSRRTAEFALRAALGASRAVVIRQLLVESGTLSLMGGVAGVVVAYGVVHAAVKLMPLDIPRVDHVSIDGRVLLFHLGVSFLTGILFGLLPAWRLSRSMPAQALRDGSRALTGARGRNHLQNGLVVTQTAVGLVLLVSSGLLIRSFIRILSVDPGFDPRHVLSARVGVSFNKLTHDQHVQFFEQTLARIAALPGVQAASAGWPLPMSGTDFDMPFNILGHPVARGEEPSERVAVVMPGYFEVMRIPLVSGRTFGEQDRTTGAPSIIVNQAFVKKYLSGEPPLRRRIQVRLGDSVVGYPHREVVGVVGDTRVASLAAAPQPQLFLPYAQTVVINPSLVIRSTGDPVMLPGAVRAAVQEIDRSVPVYQVSPLENYISQSAAQPRFQTLVLTCFAGIAVLLAALGLYGLLSYMVALRTVEIGLRMAMGAQRADVLKMIVGRGLTLTLLGVGTGVAISAGMMRLLSGMLYGIGPSDSITFAITVSLLLLISVVASLLPAYRAARVDPAQTIREQ
jgi:predicted permease